MKREQQPAMSHDHLISLSVVAMCQTSKQIVLLLMPSSPPREAAVIGSYWSYPYRGHSVTVTPEDSSTQTKFQSLYAII